ncbi:mechanosensitive ion channel family protein [Pseudoxanthomonas sacheonensis]|uniref:mechanosensitive ion channel family protein n=1 Tax=Pseudoxanthomonas sacheonensis TaxID=443615 RepID=UPI0013D7929B|nr:mechanosensitive ion channel domain-containing protein [Pseudoxanthomonas sacheonensis]KAF1708147.1 mechanosensitive ion channel protein MscS [Pseudoxanthomonas sacheonensis]
MIAQAVQKNAASAGHRALDFDSIDWLALLTNWVVAALIVLIGFWLAKWISRAIERALTRAHVETTLSGFLRNVSYAAMMVVVFIAALQKIGVPTTSVLAVVGAAGLAVGLALKDSLSNIASGVMLIMLRPFRDGDSVQIAGLEGTVEEVRIFQTRMRTADNRLIILPNSMITTAPIINFTAKPQRRIDIPLTVRYQDDPARAREILLAIATANPLVLKDPAPAVDIARLSEGGVDMTLFAWAKTKDVGEAKNRIAEAVRSQLLSHGMSLPLPPRDLHVYHHNADGTPLTEIVTRSVADDGDAVSAKPPA